MWPSIIRNSYLPYLKLPTIATLTARFKAQRFAVTTGPFPGSAAAHSRFVEIPMATALRRDN
jgi:hypothetical protein